ncbi:MAG TPA: hypothetical protein VFC79_00700 [Tissierellaceae bacterium]|nr:hypothetical protein [Tissierellaceae bacterium]
MGDILDKLIGKIVRITYSNNGRPHYFTGKFMGHDQDTIRIVSKDGDDKLIYKRHIFEIDSVNTNVFSENNSDWLDEIMSKYS